MKNGFAARVPQSVRFTVVAWTATRNSLGPTTGAGTSLIRTTSGGPYLVRTAALMTRTLRAGLGLMLANSTATSTGLGW